MKIKTDFITNSSSSSFLIAMKQTPEIDQETLDRYPILTPYIDFIEKIFGKENILKTLDEYRKSFEEEHSWGKYDTVEKIIEDEEYLMGEYEECRKYLAEGFSIFQKDVEHSEEWLETVLNSMDDGENFILIRGGG